MKKAIVSIFVFLLFSNPVFAFSWGDWNSDERAVKRLLKSQVKYANKADFNKFISTYDSKYINGDGFNLDVYSNLVKDIWETYDNIKYGIQIDEVKISDNKAIVKLVETSYAEIDMSKAYDGELRSSANTIYYLEKRNNKWKVVSDDVIDEITTMLYGDAKGLDIKLTVPNRIEPNKDYTAVLEFTPPKDTIAIASIASDIVEYPQKPTKEVYRTLPDDNILERIFTSNNQNANEYIVASIGLTKTSVSDLSLKLSLTGFGYSIRRVNVVSESKGGASDKNE